MHLTASHCLHFSLKKFVKFGNQAIQQSPGQTKSFLHNALPFNRRRMQHAVTCPQAHQILSCCNIPSLVCVTRLMDRSCNSVAESSALGYTRAWILLVASIGAPTCTFDAASIFLLASTTGQYLFFTNLFLKKFKYFNLYFVLGPMDLEGARWIIWVTFGYPSSQLVNWAGLTGLLRL